MPDKPFAYKEVRLIGPDHNDGFKNCFTDDFSATEDCLIIGDGKRFLTEDEIKKQLEGKIDKNTRIHVCGHGRKNLFDREHAMKLMHQGLVLPQFYHSYANTSSVLQFIDSLSSEPLQIYLESCYSGAANKSVEYLKPGSVLITTSDPSEGSYRSPFEKTHHQPNSSAAELFVGNLRNAEQTLTFNKRLENGGSFKYTYRPFANREIFESVSIQKYVVWAENDFIEQAVMSGGVNGTNLNVIDFEEPSPEQADQALSNHLAYLSRIGRTPSNEAIQRLSEKGKTNVLFDMVAISESINKRAFNAFVAAGADVNAKTSEGIPFLFYTADCDTFNKRAFNAFVAAGADVNAKTSNGIPLLHYIANGITFNKDAFNAFVAAGATLPRDRPFYASPEIWDEVQKEYKKYVIERKARPLRAKALQLRSQNFLLRNVLGSDSKIAEIKEQLREIYSQDDSGVKKPDATPQSGVSKDVVKRP